MTRWLELFMPIITDDSQAQALCDAARVRCDEPPALRTVVVTDDAPLSGGLAAAAIALRELLVQSAEVRAEMRHVESWSADLACPQGKRPCAPYATRAAAPWASGGRGPDTPRVGEEGAMALSIAFGVRWARRVLGRARRFAAR